MQSRLSSKVRLIEEDICGQFSERDEAIHGLLIAILAGKHALLLGPPGTGKSLLARTVCNSIVGARFFEKLLTRFTTPEEILGPYMPAELMNNKFLRKLAGYLADSHIAFLDEIYKGSSAILNTLLTLANEAIIHNDGVPIKTPLRTIIGASNEVPEEEDGLEAFDDRLQMRFMVHKIDDRDGMQAMLLSKQHVPNVTITLEELEEAKAEVDNVEISPEIIKVYLDVWSLCRQKGFDITDRVFRQGLDIIKAEAWLNGRDKVNEEDFEILQHVFWKDPKKRRDVHLEILNATNPQKSKIAEIYHEADKLIKDALKNPNAENASEKGLELLRKVKPRLQQMDKLIDEMAKTGKDTREPRKMLETLSRGLEDVTRECVGFVGFNRSK